MRFRSSVFLSVAVAVLAIVTSTHSQLIFSGNEPDTCTLKSGRPGRCVKIDSCQYALQIVLQGGSPERCGFEGSTPIVCCPGSSSTGTGTGTPGNTLKDISEPDGYSALQCGQSAVKVVHFPFGSGLTLESAIPAARRKRAAPLPSFDFDRHIDIVAVVGGHTSRRNAWPWMALVGKRDAQGDNWFCAGALINDQWVLTALHCFLRIRANVVRLGEHDYNDDFDGANHEDYDVADTITYPGYKHPEAYHDLALLKLSRKVQLQRFIRPVCLPWGRETNVDLTGKQVTLTGWGDTMFLGSRSSKLQEAIVTVFSSSQCDRSYSSLSSYSTTWPQGIGNETVCAGDPNGGRDACQGDSGGPIMSPKKDGRYVLAGIVSRGYGCGLKDYPGLYVNVRNASYLEWIKKVAF